MHSAIEAVTPESDLARLLAGHLGQNLSQAMKACYRGILTELKRLGVRKADLVVRNVETPRSATVPASRYAEDPVQHWERSLTGRLLHFDALRMRFRETRLAADPACAVCAPGMVFAGYREMQIACGADFSR